MCKRSFVTLVKGSRKYRVLTEDIKEVHRGIYKKRPSLPAYESITSDEM